MRIIRDLSRTRKEAGMSSQNCRCHAHQFITLERDDALIHFLARVASTTGLTDRSRPSMFAQQNGAHCRHVTRDKFQPALFYCPPTWCACRDGREGKNQQKRDNNDNDVTVAKRTRPYSGSFILCDCGFELGVATTVPPN